MLGILPDFCSYFIFSLLSPNTLIFVASEKFRRQDERMAKETTPKRRQADTCVYNAGGTRTWTWTWIRGGYWEGVQNCGQGSNEALQWHPSGLISSTHIHTSLKKQEKGACNDAKASESGSQSTFEIKEK